jgi:CRISPR locus-related DNA-binding protein
MATHKALFFSYHLMARKTLQIATLGFHANQRVRHVTTRRRADRVHLIYTEENRKEQEEIRELYNKDHVPVDSTCVYPWKYESILADILKIVVEHETYDIEYNISCGTIAMRAACHMAAILTGSPVHFVGEKDGDVVGDLETVQPLSFSQLTNPKKNILRSLINSGGSAESQAELGSRVSLGVSSISKHVKELQKLGYIEKTEQNGRHFLRITDLGRIILELKKARKDGRRS